MLPRRRKEEKRGKYFTRHPTPKKKRGILSLPGEKKKRTGEALIHNDTKKKERRGPLVDQEEKNIF